MFALVAFPPVPPALVTATEIRGGDLGRRIALWSCVGRRLAANALLN